MQTEALFAKTLPSEFKRKFKSLKSIYIAVAWFTNIFWEVIVKASEGCMIHIIISNDDINNNSSIDFEPHKLMGKFIK
jgi:hypothetical protein